MMIIRVVAGVAVIFILAGCAGSNEIVRSERLGLELILIPGGSFEMGDSFEGTNEDALPVHTVVVAPFYISKFESTFGQFDVFAKATGRPLPLPDDVVRESRAVTDVSWDEANAFCFFAGGRLPTEIEWEYAAAGGSAKQIYAGTNDFLSAGTVAHHRENSEGMTRPVGEKKESFFGLYDMSGNAAEWVSDYYEKYPEQGEEPVYMVLHEREMRLARGGSVSSAEHIARTYWRAGTLRSVRTPYVGFRCVMDVN